MAIQFARCEYVSRSTGGNACRKASYNQRDQVRCERTGELFSFKARDGNVHHEILLPEGVAGKFKNSSILWNEVEACEERINSQVAKEFVLALPDNAEVTLEDRIELTRRFSQILVERGVAVQLDVHSPHDSEKNWHAHLLVTTRRFSEDGLSLAAKARDLDPVIRGGKVVEANIWGEMWRDLQNDYFQEKGYDLRVDPIGIVPQEHLGPVRMRHHMNEALLRAGLLQKANEKVSQDPQAVLEEMTRNRAVFTQKDLEHFLHKHVPLEVKGDLLNKTLSQQDIVPLYDKNTGQKTAYFTTKTVRSEEEKLLRFADIVANKKTFPLGTTAIMRGLAGKDLNPEQREAFDLCVSSRKNLCIIQGRAGVGKSYVLGAIREAHEASHFRVLGLAPTHKVVMDLKQDGFKETKTCHSFLFALKNGREKLDSSTVVVVDEAGMLGTTLSVELFHVIKNSGAKLVLVGDDRQLSSVERGGTFKFLSERYGATELRDVRRQSIGWQKAVSEALAEGKIKEAVQLLEENKAIAWATTKEESLSELLKSWSRDNLLKPHETRQIITQRNVDVDTLNQGIRDILRAQGRLGDTEIICNTQRGRIAFAEGDRVQFTKTDKEQGLIKASFGTIERIDPNTKKLTVRLDTQEVKEVNPDTYDGLRHGYASTVYKAQGATIDHVYVLHNRSANQPTNYVALSRQTKSLHLYVSHDETPSQASLIHQMGRQDGNGTSLVFDTLQDIEKRQEEKTLSTQLKHGAEALLTKVKDVFHRNEKFYQFEKPANINQENAEIVVNKFQDEINKQDEDKNKDDNSRQDGNRNQDNNKEASPSYQKDTTKITEKNLDQRVPQLKSSAPSPAYLKTPPTTLDAKIIEEALRHNIVSFADDIFSSIGEPYHPSSSSAIERRYGKNGHIALNLKTGAWINYKDTDKAGGPLHMLTKLKGLSFKEALDYGANWAGLSQTGIERADFKAPVSPSQLNIKVNNIKGELQAENKAKIDKAQALWAQGRSIQGTLAERYLREYRKIEGPLPEDLLYLPFFTDLNSKWTAPCLMAAARSPEGQVTGVQLTFLNANTAQKADIPVPKRSFGVIKGSSVTIQEDKASGVLFIAEGIETALSLRSAGLQGTIKSSLGLSNIKRIVPESQNTFIVICADHDAPDSPAAKSLDKSITFIQGKGYVVIVVKPDKLNQDFNDVLKAQGSQGVREIFEKAHLKDTLPRELIKFVPHEKEVPLQLPILKPLTHKNVFEAQAPAKKAAEDSEKIPSQKSVEQAKPLDHALLKEKPLAPTGEMVFDELTQQCRQKLFAYLGENRIELTSERLKRMEIQAEKAAHFIFHAHTTNGTRPTGKQIEHFLLRAKYELNRVPEIREELTHKWRQVGIYKGERDELIAHMMAERQASIEGRMYLEAKQRDVKPSPHIPELAIKEIEQSKATEARLTSDLRTKQNLSESAAAFCAKDIVSYFETHGQKPTAEQISAMVQISRNLDYDPSSGSHNVEYHRTRDGKVQFRGWSASRKDFSGFRDFPYAAQDYARSESRTTSYEQNKTIPSSKAFEKVYEIDFSM